jgi:site-specific DNA-methyltransferase (adenine-specific)
VKYQQGAAQRPLFIQGNALSVLSELPPETFDICMTSPPYWGQRQYASAGIGLEDDFRDYIRDLAAVCREVQRVLKPTGSFWLNLGDTYQDKRLLGIPWRVALELTDRQGWLLRNDVIWNKVKGGLDNTGDKLRNLHEHVFHFTRQRNYYYDIDAIRSNPRKSRVLNGAVVSATGVSGVRYRRQIELSTALSETEKRQALLALEQILQEIVDGKLSDFRMIIRGQQRATHSDSERVSGRARELRERGFYFLKYHPKGSKPGDVWDILPEDTQNRTSHFAPYPEDLCKIPLLATCPEDGLVLDPFCGTGTTMRVAFQLGRKSVGIDVAGEYLALARERCQFLL